MLSSEKAKQFVPLFVLRFTLYGMCTFSHKTIQGKYTSISTERKNVQAQKKRLGVVHALVNHNSILSVSAVLIHT